MDSSQKRLSLLTWNVEKMELLHPAQTVNVIVLPLREVQIFYTDYIHVRDHIKGLN